MAGDRLAKTEATVTPFSELSEPEKQVLRALAERASDGYTLLSRTRLTLDELEPVIKKLVDMGLVAVKGETSGEQLGGSYFWVPPNAQSKADYLLGKLMAF